MLKDLAEVKRGEDAEALLNHPLFKEAFESVKIGIIESMGTSPMGDEKTHNRLVIALQLLAQIKKTLENHIQTGKMAQIQMNDGTFNKIRRVAGIM